MHPQSVRYPGQRRSLYCPRDQTVCSAPLCCRKVREMTSTPAQVPAPMMLNDTGLAGKLVIVTGGGAFDDGISNGRAAAILCARAGRTSSWWAAAGAPRSARCR